MRTWKVIQGEPLHPQENMDSDANALKELKPDDAPVLRFYSWRGIAATYGYFIDPDHTFNKEGLKETGLLIGRRPTGGGVLFHHIDLAFSLLIPASHPLYGKNALDSYYRIHSVLLEALREVLHLPKPTLQDSKGVTPHSQFCMAHPTIYDLLISGKKAAGAAQRRTKQGVLHQGSLCLNPPDQELIKRVLLPHPGLAEAMETFSYPLGMSNAERRAFTEAFQVSLVKSAD
jgi:lipoate---protein ligase